MLFTETLPSLPYSLWALPDWSGWLDWLAWLVRLWVARKNRSLSPKKSRSTIRVSVGLPPAAHVPRRTRAGGRTRTTPWSTVSSAYGSLGPWHTLGSQNGHMHGWEASWTTLVYTYIHTSACTKVGSDAHQAHKEVREQRAFLGLLCSPSCPLIHQAACAGWEAGQLEREIITNAWLTVPADPALIFSSDYKNKTQRAASILGVDLQQLAPAAGHS